MTECGELDLLDTVWDIDRTRYNDCLSSPVLGAYGVVCFADDVQTGRRVAIKKIASPFDSSRQAMMAYRELRLLKHVNHENVVRLLDVFTKAATCVEMDSFYLVTNFMETNLGSVLQKGQKLDDLVIRFFSYQLFRGLKYLHSCNIIHRDLKPSNITVNSECELRIIDFGWSRTDKQLDMTPYVVTRWYRAADSLIFGNYTKAVDVWSVGCIIAECYSGIPIFRGADYNDQIQVILKVIGFPSDEMYNNLDSCTKDYFDKISPKPERVNFHEYFSFIRDPRAIDLIEKIFHLNPCQRITSAEALEHPFFEGFHEPDDEPTGEEYLDLYEDANFSVDQWKSLIFKEIKSFTAPPVEEDHTTEE